MFVLHTTALSQTVQKQLSSVPGLLISCRRRAVADGIKQTTFLVEMANTKKEGT